MTRALHSAALLLTALMLANASEAEARHRHHAHHFARTTPHRFVFPTPQDATENAAAAATLLTGPIGDFGILGATTADPYQHPAVGYDITGRYGPGYLYPD